MDNKIAIQPLSDSNWGNKSSGREVFLNLKSESHMIKDLNGFGEKEEAGKHM